MVKDHSLLTGIHPQQDQNKVQYEQLTTEAWQVLNIEERTKKMHWDTDPTVLSVGKKSKEVLKSGWCQK